LSERKGVDVILRGVDALLADFTGVAFVGSGPLDSRVRELCRARPRAVALGFLEGVELVSAFEQAAVVLTPSRYDPWPLVACEGLSAGRPVVLGPQVGSVPDLARVAGDAVVVMNDYTPGELSRSARLAKGAVVPLEARRSFSPALGAQRFAEAVNLALLAET
jgi:glycosyltransferase involved in cell wall biosynthesis